MESMGSEFHFRDKITVAILGATESVGQRFVDLLSRHLWFKIVALGASENFLDRPYGEVTKWLLPTSLPESIAIMPLSECKPPTAANIVFSALDSSKASEIERAYAKAGSIVITNAKTFRMLPNIPLLIPEVNSDHLTGLAQQKEGKIMANPSSCSVGLSIALKPLINFFDVEAVHVVTMQAISSESYPGLSAFDIQDNVIPYIENEEEKLETEPLKILGKWEQDHFSQSTIKISAQCNLIPVTDGYTQCISIKFRQKPSKKEVIEAWRAFSGEPQKLALPSAPEFPIHYFDQENLPQPKLQRNIDKGMAVSIGHLRECPLFDYKFNLVFHNMIRGAVGNAILSAELLVRKGHVFW